MKKLNVIVAGLFILFACGVYFVADGFTTSAMSSGQLGNDFFPKCVAGLIVILSLTLLAQTKARKDWSDAPTMGEIFIPKDMLMPLLGALVLLSYTLLIELFGFLLCTTVMIVAYLLLFRCKKLIYYIIVPLIGGVGVYFLFEKVFIVMLPSGSIFG